MTVALPSHLLTSPDTMPDRVADRICDSGAWAAILAARAGAGVIESAHYPVYGPLVSAGRASRLVIGQFGQSLDGRIATPSGESKYLNGVGGLSHLHRLRALVDAVVVGVSTVVADDPLLTVRMVEGASPARVVIDPTGRVPRGARVFADDGARRIVVTDVGCDAAFPDGVEVVPVAGIDRGLPPAAIVAALANAGLRQLLIEGGAHTVSRFLQSGMLDRLHVAVAPVLIGGGRAGISLCDINTLSDCLRPKIDVHRLGDDVLFDCQFG